MKNNNLLLKISGVLYLVGFIIAKGFNIDRGGWVGAFKMVLSIVIPALIIGYFMHKVFGEKSTPKEGAVLGLLIGGVIYSLYAIGGVFAI